MFLLAHGILIFLWSARCVYSAYVLRWQQCHLNIKASALFNQLWFSAGSIELVLLRSCAFALLRLALLRLARFIVVFEFKNKLKLVWASISMAPCKYLVKFLLSCARRLRVAHCANFGALTPVLGGAHLCLCDLVN